MAQDLPGLLPGVEPRQQIQNCQPEVVSHHHDQDHDEEDGQLAGDAALIGQPQKVPAIKKGRMGITTRETTASTTRWNSSSTWVMTLARVQVAARPTSTERPARTSPT